MTSRLTELKEDKEEGEETVDNQSTYLSKRVCLFASQST